MRKLTDNIFEQQSSAARMNNKGAISLGLIRGFLDRYPCGVLLKGCVEPSSVVLVTIHIFMKIPFL